MVTTINVINSFGGGSVIEARCVCSDAITQNILLCFICDLHPKLPISVYVQSLFFSCIVVSNCSKNRCRF